MDVSGRRGRAPCGVSHGSPIPASRGPERARSERRGPCPGLFLVLEEERAVVEGRSSGSRIYRPPCLPGLATSGFVRCAYPVTATGSRRILTGFPQIERAVRLARPAHRRLRRWVTLDLIVSCVLPQLRTPCQTSRRARVKWPGG